jgi:hypothetical protein
MAMMEFLQTTTLELEVAIDTFIHHPSPRPLP